MIGVSKRDMTFGMNTLPSSKVQMAISAVNIEHFSSESELWHRRLAHLNKYALKWIHQHVIGVPKLSGKLGPCRACVLGKAHKQPFSGQFHPASIIGEIVHSDIVGKLEMSFPDHYRYFCTFLDDFSRYSFIGLLHNRSDLQEAFTMM